MPWMFKGFVFLLKVLDQTKVSVKKFNLQKLWCKGLIKIGFSIYSTSYTKA
jgi:hypothetical protein